MNRIVRSDAPVTLLGGAPIAPADLDEALALAPRIVAADGGGAAAALAAGVRPEAVIGDLDSLNTATRAAIPAGRLHRVADQDSTDFQKCLATIDAPLVLGLGFLGARVDHALAALGALAAWKGRVALIDPHEVILACPPDLRLDLAPGTRVSLFPMAPVTGRSEGLEWPIDGLELAPMGRVGTSNRATGPVRIRMDGPGCLALLPRPWLRAALAGLRDAAPWP